MLISALRGFFRGLVSVLRGFVSALRHRPRALPPPREIPEIPVECPVCNGMLVAVVEHRDVEDETGTLIYECRGVTGRAEVEARSLRHPSRLRLVGVTDVPPCGFRGKGSDYGTIWV